MKRIVIMGSSCSGKTTLSKQLAERLGMKRIELDAINWMPGWQERDFGGFRDIVDKETQAEAWVVDGNYGSRLGKMHIDRADTIIWLNLPFWTVYLRLWGRLYRRVVQKEELWNGNRETFYLTLFHKDSLLYWIPKTWRDRQRKLRKLFDAPPPAKNMLEFRGVTEIDAWLATL